MKDFIAFITTFIKRAWILLLIIAIIVVAGVSSVEIIREEVLNINPDVTYVESDTIYLSCEALDTLNPVLSKSEDVYHLSKLIYNSLFEYDENLNVVPELIESYEVHERYGKVSVKLKEGIKWHNDTEFTAKDIQFTVNAMNYAGSRSLYYDKSSKISYVRVNGDYEADIYFRNLADASLDDLTFPILPSTQYSTPGQLVYASDDFKPVGTGQYRFQSYNYLKQLKLKPYDNYFGTKAEKKLEVLILPEKELSSNMLEISSVTCYMDETTERKSIAIDKQFTLYDILSNEVEFIVFNTLKAPMDNKAMRQAVASAINEKNILENGYMNDGVLSDTIYYPNFNGVMDSGTYYNYDPEGAAAALETLGYKDRNNDGLLESAGGKDAEITIIVNKNNATRLAAARLIEKDLEAIGFKAALEELSWSDYEKAIAANKFDILVTGYTIEAQYDLRSFFNGTNPWRYNNRQLLTMAGELERLHTAEEYTELYGQLKEAMLDELPYLPLCYKKIGLVGVQGFNASRVPMFNDHYKNIETWNWSYLQENEPEEGQAEQKSEDGAESSNSDLE